MTKYLLSILLAFLMLLLTMGGLSAQQGTFPINGGYWLHRNLGPGLGAEQIPPPNVGKSTLSVGVEMRWDFRFSWEVTPVLNAPAGTLDGYFTSTLRHEPYWKLTAGTYQHPDLVEFLSRRARFQPMTLDGTYPPGTTWDGVVDWQGATVQSTTQVVQMRRYEVSIPLASIAQAGDLWLEVPPPPGSIVGIQSNGWKHHWTSYPWTAQITYRYGP